MSTLCSLFINCLLVVALVQGRALSNSGISLARGYPQQQQHQRTMMLTAGYYRPIRRNNEAQQLTGVFAQGNAVSGGSYLGDNNDPADYEQHQQPNVENEGNIDQENPGIISSSEAEAAPNRPLFDDNDHHSNNDNNGPTLINDTKQHQGEVSSNEGGIEKPAEGIVPERDVNRNDNKKNKQRQRPAKRRPSQDENDYDEDNEENKEEDDDEGENSPVVPFVPFKSNRRRNNMPNLNNFFPMVFSYPRSVVRTRNSGGDSGETEGLPGMVTAIANSYSTSKGGMASSVATAYGASPTDQQQYQQGKKHRRANPSLQQ